MTEIDIHDLAIHDPNTFRIVRGRGSLFESFSTEVQDNLTTPSPQIQGDREGYLTRRDKVVNAIDHVNSILMHRGKCIDSSGNSMTLEKKAEVISPALRMNDGGTLSPRGVYEFFGGRIPTADDYDTYKTIIKVAQLLQSDIEFQKSQQGETQ